MCSQKVITADDSSCVCQFRMFTVELWKLPVTVSLAKRGEMQIENADDA